MLSITIPANEYWDPEKREFLQIKETKLQLEHSLISLSKWESKYHKPFLEQDPKNMSTDELLDYIRFMTITQNIPYETYYGLTEENVKSIVDYIDNPMTATWFSEDKNPSRRKPIKKKIITNEVLYASMVEAQVPFEAQKWHLNRLITLLRVLAARARANDPKQKKRSKAQIAQDYARLNEQRRKALHTNG